MPAILAFRASRSSRLLEVLHFLEEVRKPVRTVEVTLSNPGGGSRQRRRWLVGSRDIRDLAAEVVMYIKERATLWGRVDAIVVA